MVAVCYRRGVIIRTAATGSGSLSSMVVMGSLGGRGQATRGTVGLVTLMGIRVEADVKTEVHDFD